MKNVPGFTTGMCDVTMFLRPLFFLDRSVQDNNLGDQGARALGKALQRGSAMSQLMCVR